MFSTNHFIWIGISVLIIAVYLFVNKKKNLSFNTNLNILCIVCFISECIKTFYKMKINAAGDGRILDPGDLPFHLCSMQIFFVLYLKVFCKNENTKQTILQFMFPTMCVGGFMALMIPTVGTEFTNPQVYQFFGFHSVIIAFAIYLIVFKQINVTMKTIFRNYAILIGILFLGIWINSILSVYDTNFLYVTRPPMEGLPYLSMAHGWYVYFVHYLLLAIILLFAFQYPFVLLCKKRNTKQELI